MKWQVIKIRLFRAVRRAVLYGGYLAIVFLLSAFFVLQLPPVQQNLVQRYTQQFAKASGFTVRVRSFYLLWYDRLTLEGLEVVDPEQNTMVRAERLKINFNLTSLLLNNNINLDAAALDSVQVLLKPIAETDSTRELNFTMLIERLSSPSGTGGKSTQVNIGEILIDRSTFTYHADADSITTGFNYHHFQLDLDAGEISRFNVIGDTIQFQLRSLHARDVQTKLAVTQLQTYFRYCRTGMEFYNLQMAVGKSFIADTVVLAFQSPRDLSDFNNKVRMHASLKNTRLHPDDLALFAQDASKLQNPITLSGTLRGRVARFSLGDMDLQSGSSRFSGRIEMDGLPALRETFTTLSLANSVAAVRDLQPFLPARIYQQLLPLGRLAINGTFTGFTNDFVAKADVNSSLGRINSDINLKIDEQNLDRSTYRGNLTLTNFKLGRYLNDTTVYQNVTLQGRVRGSGLSRESADFTLVSTIKSLGLYGYNYTGITTNAHFASQFFSGYLTVDDPHLQFSAHGNVDFRKGLNLVQVMATIDTARLQPLGLSKQPVFVATTLDVNSRGLHIDSLAGTAIFTSTVIDYQNNRLHLDSVLITSTQERNERSLQLQSSYADATLQGDFTYSTLFHDLTTLGYEFLIGIANDREKIQSYYTTKKHEITEYQVRMMFTLRNLQPLLDLVGADVSIARHTRITGRFKNSNKSVIQLSMRPDTLRWADKVLLNNELTLAASKDRDSAAVLAIADFSSAQQLIGSRLKTKSLVAKAIWDKDHVRASLDAEQEGADNSIQLNTQIDFLRDSTRIKILPSRLTVLSRPWLIDSRNYILFARKEFLLRNLEFRNGTQSIRVEGDLSTDRDRTITLAMTNLNLDLLNTFSTEKFAGTLDGTITARDVYANPYIQNNLLAKNFTINDFLIGDIMGTNEWNASRKVFDIDFLIDRLGQRTLALRGFYNPEETNSPLELTANVNQANLKIIEPLLRGIFSNMDGELTGQYRIYGSPTKPMLEGEGNITDGQIKIDYLNTSYQFSGRLGLTPNQLVFTDFELADGFNNKGTLYGYVAHKNFSKFRINIDAAFKNLHLLNTTAKDNSLFYGQGFATGNLNIFGPASNLKISATARTDKNSKIFIPINSSGSVDKKEFITFSNFTNPDSARNNAAKTQQKIADLSGIVMDLNLDITPDAYAEIIFDIKAGDIIRGRGNGDIKLQLDTKGEFNMFGVIEFTEGAYNFTLYDIINKEFSVKPGSRITWYGDPYQGTMNVTASYRQLAALGPILSNRDPELATAPAIRRKYPVEVLLKLDGPMLSPQINFDLAANDLPDNVAVEGKPPVRLGFEFNAFKARLDEQELKRQVFSLIVLRRFSPPDAFATSGSLYSSVSEFLTNQLSYWITQVDQNLEIDLDLGTLDQEAFNTFQLRLSYSFFNGRLRVTRDGTFTNTNQTTQSNAAALAGDWTVDYMLSPDGKFKVKMYSRSNFNTLINSLGAQTAVTTGFSLLHTQNFNEMRDLWRSARERRRKNPDEGEEADSEQPGSKY